MPLPLLDRAPAAADPPTDRVFLKDYVRTVEVGVYPEEFGARQRLRFNVVLEVARRDHLADDPDDPPVNYDRLVRAIETVAEAGRINFLETFAERIAAACLAHPEARSVQVAIEKLDRLHDGATLGIEIARTRSAAPAPAAGATA